MKTPYFLIGLMALSTSLQAEIYKWTDSDGNVHFSDKAHQGAETIQLPPVQTYSPPKEEAPSAPVLNNASTNDVAYTSVAFVQPVDQATVRDNRGNFSVVINVEPTLDPDDKIQLLLDGNPIGTPKNTTALQLTGVNRGSHSLQAQILNSDGQVLKSSEIITIYLHRARMGRGG